MTSILPGRHFPDSHSKREGSRSRYGKRKGNTGVALEILSLAQFLKRSSSGSGSCTRHSSAVLFSTNFREATMFDFTSAGGTVLRYAMRISNRHAAVVPRRTARRSASCTYLPGTCTTLFTTRSYTPSLPHGAIVLKIKKCVTGSEGKKLGSRESSWRCQAQENVTLLSSLPLLAHPLSLPSFSLSVFLLLSSLIRPRIRPEEPTRARLTFER